MAAESVDIVFLSSSRLRFLWTPARALAWIAVLLAIAALLFYGYRILMLKREQALVTITPKRPVDRAHLFSCLFYFNKNDPALFVDKYAFNFANKWVYALVACMVAYPLLVFATSLE